MSIPKSKDVKTLIVRPGETRTAAPLTMGREELLIKIAGKDTNDQFALCYVTVPPMGGPPVHMHTREEECFYVLEGELAFEIDGERSVMEQGSCVLGPRNKTHAYQNFSQSTARLLILAVPAGLDRLFEAMAGAAPKGGAPDPEVMAELARAHGGTFNGPPLMPR